MLTWADTLLEDVGLARPKFARKVVRYQDRVGHGIQALTSMDNAGQSLSHAPPQPEKFGAEGRPIRGGTEEHD